MKEFYTLLQTVSSFPGVKILDSLCEIDDGIYITFQCEAGAHFNSISSQISEISETHHCKLLAFPGYDEQMESAHQIVFDGDPETVLRAILVLNKMLRSVLETGSPAKAKQQELGIPDLSLTTIRQMATELKRRENLCFAVVWIEDNERDNIAIEGSGNPTQLVGLLSRGLHMTIEWADKNIKFHKPKDE